MWESIRGFFRDLWGSTDNITKWIQVLALCIAAWWTFNNYSVAEKPSLEPNLRVDAWFSKPLPGWEPDTCRVAYNLKVKNEGKVSFNVVKIRFRAWQLPIPKGDTKKQATFVDAESFSEGTPFLDQTIGHANLIKHYVPGESLDQGFTWILRRQAPGITSFVVDITAKSGKRETTRPGRHWADDLCVQSANSDEQQ